MQLIELHTESSHNGGMVLSQVAGPILTAVALKLSKSKVWLYKVINYTITNIRMSNGCTRQRYLHFTSTRIILSKIFADHRNTDV